MKLIREQDDFEWIREIPTNISFEDAKEGKTYKIEPTEVLIDSIRACDMRENIYDSREAKVLRKSIVPYNNIYCDHDNEGRVIGLHLRFKIKEDKWDTFWVAPDMVKLYEMDEPMNESLDDFEWIQDIPTGIELEPNTFYYFNPPLKSNEIPGFVDRITNSDRIKKLLMGANERGANVTYFVTHWLDPNETFKGWCTETPPYQGMKMYPNANKVDARKQFYL